MKNYKIEVIGKIEEMSNSLHSVSLRNAANAIGIKHLKTQECSEILNAFVKRNPSFKIYKLADNPIDSLFCSAFVSDNETFPIKEA